MYKYGGVGVVHMAYTDIRVMCVRVICAASNVAQHLYFKARFNRAAT